MAIIGFIALLAFGLYLFISGIMAEVVTMGFSGKPNGIGFILMAIGGGLLYLAWVEKPFKIVLG